jgi:AraC-like DNA-binding protein
LEGSVVKSYALNGADRLTDYGVYDEVVNLTDSAPVTLGEGTASFQFSQTPGHFYFEGKTGTPFRNLPWTVTLRYTLNGVPIRAEELAGQKGVVEIAMDVVPNRGASAYARYNYTLEAMAMFNQDDILSLEAPGAQVQLVGNLRTVLFMCLPGEEQHFTIRVGSDDFSFDGMTILMVPATLSQLQEIAKLSQRKDDLEKDYKALSGSLDALLDALNDVQDGLNASASGLDRLDTARGTISAGKNTLPDFFVRCVLIDILTALINAMNQKNIKFREYRDIYFEALYFCRSYPYPEKKAEIQAHIKQLLTLFQSEAESQFINAAQIQQLVEECYTSTEFSISYLADIFHVSITYMSFLFKKEMGENFSDYVWALRLEKAKKLLLTTDMPIDDISLAVGYLNASSFRRKFKQTTGMTPSQMRG